MQVVIVGGGISGLVCAYQLKQAGIQVALLEQSSRLGGAIETQRQDGFQFELGPQSFLSNATLLELVSSLGIEKDLLRADPKAPRFILLGGRLIPAPMGPPQLVFSPLLGAGTKFRLLTEPFRKTSPPDGDESLAAFVRRKFGNDLLENLAGPFVSGIHAGDPERLSVRAAFPFLYEWERDFGSVLRGAMKSRPPKGTPRPTLSTFREGVSGLVKALGQSLGNCIFTDAKVESIVRKKANGSPRLEVRFEHHGRGEVFNVPAVVVATDTSAAGRLLAAISGKFTALLGRIEYAAVAVVGGGYKREQVGHPVQGFGFLVPRKEGLRVLGTVWCSSLFPERAPEGMINLTSFVGGATDPGILNLTAEQVAETAEKELAKVLRISGEPVTRITKMWPRALPQYNLGHGETVAAIQSELGKIPGLFLAGNYLAGASVGYCAEQAVKTASQVRDYLASSVRS